jgi:hypothetical protein
LSWLGICHGSLSSESRIQNKVSRAVTHVHRDKQNPIYVPRYKFTKYLSAPNGLKGCMWFSDDVSLQLRKCTRKRVRLADQQGHGPIMADTEMVDV